jgi:hypothetical protein
MKHPCEVHPKDGELLELKKGGCTYCVLRKNPCKHSLQEMDACVAAIGWKRYAYATEQPKPAPTPFFGVGNVNYCGTTYEVTR